MLFALVFATLWVAASTTAFADKDPSAHVSGGGHKKSEGSGSKSYGRGKSAGSHEKSRFRESRGSSPGHAWKKWDRPFHWILEHKDEIGLTKDQHGRICDLQFNFRVNRIQSEADLSIAKMKLMRQLYADELEEGKIRDASKKLADFKAQKINSWVEAKIRLRKILTKEQRAKAKQIYSLKK